MRIGVICSNQGYRGGQDLPFPALIAGLQATGYDVSVQIISGDADVDFDAIFLWQPKNPAYKTLLPRIECPIFLMERGWLDRFNYTQIDHQGFNHMASWAHMVSGAAPIDGIGRYQGLCELLSPPKRVESRRTGYVLILGQTGGDTQLKQSEIHHPDALCDSVLAQLPGGLDVAYRRHPLDKYIPSNIESLDGTLQEALNGARFVVTINSNAGNDALWAGVPVLCLGPALYEIAGAARRTSIATLLHDMEFMAQGWHPDERRVTSYFHWLASRQWNRKELEQGDVLARLIGEICP